LLTWGSISSICLSNKNVLAVSSAQLQPILAAVSVDIPKDVVDVLQPTDGPIMSGSALAAR
jgi:hypothetical protein